MLPNAFIFTLELGDEIRPITDMCLQRHYCLDNVDFKEIVSFAIRLIQASNDTPGNASRIDTFVSKVCCFVEANILPGSVDQATTNAIIVELEQQLCNGINNFVTGFLNKLQHTYNLISVDHYGYINTAYTFKLLEVHSYGTVNVQLTKIQG